MIKNPTMTFMVLIFISVTIVSVFGKDNGLGANTDHWLAPPASKNIKNPIKNDENVRKEGKKIFDQQCATCHGNSGKGDGPAGKYLGKKLPDFTSAIFNQQSDGEIYWKITNGNTPMPAFKEILTEEQRWKAINYLRTFASH